MALTEDMIQLLASGVAHQVGGCTNAGRPVVCRGLAAQHEAGRLLVIISSESGFEVLDAIRRDQQTRLLPLVVLTSSAQERDRLQTYSLGANSYIVKPVDFEQFLEATRQIGMYWLMLNTAPPDPERNGHAPAAP